jgi:crossover junction endodeoxyribonuclease RuvC
MRVLGIDCGTEFTGFGVVEQVDGKLSFVCAGAIRLSKRDTMPQRLCQVNGELAAIIEACEPAVAAIEDVFYAVNAKSALKLGQVRGVAMMTAASHRLEVVGYAPLAIKSAVVGYGKAEKFQVQSMVARLLNLEVLPQPPDAADALAIAICHLHTNATLLRYHAKAR